MAHVLVIDDQPTQRHIVIESIRRHGHTARGASDLEQARASSASEACAVVVLTVRRGSSCTATVTLAKAEWPDSELIVIGNSHNLAEATAAVRQGAYDYIAIGDGDRTLVAAILATLDHCRIVNRSSRPLSDVAPEHAVSSDPPTRALFGKADRVALVNTTVLITGESGTGKEVLARRIHQHSSRRQRKFVPVNCGSLPETLIETELFGYKKGAFTGATVNSKGLVEEAEGGVLFLDEIGDMPLSMQVRLLRFLDSGEVRAVGDTVVKHVDVRVIAATNRSLPTEITGKRFREDLYFRLSVISLHVPPLRERRADIPELVRQVATRVAARHGIPVPAIADEAMAVLVDYRWPGNIRELQNVIEQALVEQSSGTIALVDLPAAVRNPVCCLLPTVSGPEHVGDLLTVLERNNGNQTHAAAELGISRTTLWRRLRDRGGAEFSSAKRGFR